MRVAGPMTVQIPAQPRMLHMVPPDLTSRELRRLGEGIGKVVYASRYWVVVRERSPSEIVALIVLWRGLRKFERVLPWGARLLRKPSRQIRFLRVATQVMMSVLPRSLWFTTHVRDVWRLYRQGSLRGERLADQQLVGTSLIPERVAFPPTRVRVPGWPGYLLVSQAAERVECTLLERLTQMADARCWTVLEQWLEKLLEARQSGWRRGLFTTDAHLKNYGVSGERIVLLDMGGLTDQWDEIEKRIAFEQSVEKPHVRLGLAKVLAERPDIAERFDARWKKVVNIETVKACWPAADAAVRAAGG